MDSAISLDHLGKMYRLYNRPADRVLDALGVNRWLFWRKDYYRPFWALRRLCLDVPRGQRLGIIGRNGAGKSTLLKLICGNLTPSEGSLHVNGRVQALMELGTGFHPEFTGRQNIHAALAYQGWTSRRAADREAEIIDFAEIDGFIDQPVKTYSAGMYTRLAFATATAIEPDILIIDEVLGAGDAYFAGKCFQRMRQLAVGSGATVLFVSHDLGSVQKLCDRVVWIEHGGLQMDGDPLAVSKAYYKTVQEEEGRRLMARAVETAAVPKENLQGSAGSSSIVTWTRPDPRIETVRFIDGDGHAVGGIETGSDLIVEVHYEAKGAVVDPVFAMSIYLPDGTLVCHANTALADLKLGTVQGRGRVCFEFRPFLAGDGEYVLSCSIFKELDPRHCVVQPPYYDQHDRAYRFRVWKKLGVHMNLGLLRLPCTTSHYPEHVEQHTGPLTP